MRRILSFVIGLTCTALVAVGLYLSLGPNGEGIVLDRPGTPARLASGGTSATAFFEVDGNMLELTMLFSEPEDPGSIFRTRVRLMDGQSHTIVVGEPGDDSGPQRYTFRRKGYTVEMHRAPATTLNASFAAGN
ncbi:MAG: hypothetical protein ACFB03_09660 [Paracoccaceae bacterium]